MPITFLTTALLIVSLLTNLTVEGVKKLLDETPIKYSSNVLAAVFAVIIAGVTCAIYMIMEEVPFDLKIGVQIVVVMYLGFLISTVGYDKIMQTVMQIQQSIQKKEKEKEKEEELSNGSDSQ